MLAGLKKPSVIPGFGLTLGFSVAYLSILVLIPFAALGLKASGVGWGGFLDIVTDPRVQAAFRVSFGCAFLAACINAVFGLLVTWVLVRYSFPGKRIVDALVDLPFALPTAVAGIALTTLYARTAPSAAFSSRSAGGSPTRRSASSSP